ncbi:MAG: methyltransferase domain-containing protein [Sedimentisphaerales bacterium]
MKNKFNESADNQNQKFPVINGPVPQPSVYKAMNQYNTAETAERFNAGVIGTKTDHREKKCVTKALKIADIPAGAHILDLPCGAGRLLPLLKRFGYKVTGADISDYMLLQARRYAGPAGENCLEETDSLQTANIFQTGFKDKCFDAVLCHRLFQYFPEPQLRQQALKELKRISRGPIIISFKCNLAVNCLASYARRKFLRRKDRGCKPIDYKAFAQDAKEAGLTVKKWILTLPLISERWYVILEPDNASNAETSRMNSAIAKSKLGRISRIAAVAAAIVIGVFLWPHVRAVTEPDAFKIESIARKYQDGNDRFYVVSAAHRFAGLNTDKNLFIMDDVEKIFEKIINDRSKSKDSYFFVAARDISKIKNTPAWNYLRFIITLQVGGEDFVLLNAELPQAI